MSFLFFPPTHVRLSKRETIVHKCFLCGHQIEHRSLGRKKPTALAKLQINRLEYLETDCEILVQCGTRREVHEVGR